MREFACVWKKKPTFLALFKKSGDGLWKSSYFGKAEKTAALPFTLKYSSWYFLCFGSDRGHEAQVVEIFSQHWMVYDKTGRYVDTRKTLDVGLSQLVSGGSVSGAHEVI